MTRPAEDLHVFDCVGATKREWDDVVDIPALTGWDGHGAGGASAFVGEEEVKAGSG